jgi:hypothetical protein
MLYELKIKLTTPFLGNQKTREQVRRFQRNKKTHDLVLDIFQWAWALKEACVAVKLDNLVDTTAIRLPEEIKAPKLELYVRKWKNDKGFQQEEMFESIKSGAVLTMEILITQESYRPENKNNNLRGPTMEEFEKILKLAGELIGLSPWGSHFGYGRFKVHSLLQK